uniref:Uncharacterized protein n=1 Tax=Steinernema glaseri TaxID=37863 RepID=A0A1I7Y3Z0_9BILA
MEAYLRRVCDSTKAETSDSRRTSNISSIVVEGETLEHSETALKPDKEDTIESIFGMRTTDNKTTPFIP